MAKHECKPATGCCCYQLADEPNEDCPQHGYPIPRCDCGRFVSRKCIEYDEYSGPADAPTDAESASERDERLTRRERELSPAAAVTAVFDAFQRVQREMKR